MVLEEPQKIQIEIRLPRLGAIAGKIVDENDVGLLEHDVVVFRNTRPPVLVNRVSSDDRGMFRFGLLEPGAMCFLLFGLRRRRSDIVEAVAVQRPEVLGEAPTEQAVQRDAGGG